MFPRGSVALDIFLVTWLLQWGSEYRTSNILNHLITRQIFDRFSNGCCSHLFFKPMKNHNGFHTVFFAKLHHFIRKIFLQLSNIIKQSMLVNHSKTGQMFSNGPEVRGPVLGYDRPFTQRTGIQIPTVQYQGLAHILQK